MTPSKAAVIAVRPNPAHYALDFTDEAKPERELMSLILSERRSVSLVGLPGSGKTVILRSLAYQSAVMALFRDGIYLIQLSATMTAATLFEYFAELLEKLGTSSQVADFREELKESSSVDHRKSVDLFISFIRDRKALIIIDNVSSEPSELFDLVLMFIRSTPRTRRFTLACSTRSHDAARVFSGPAVVNVPLHDPTGSASRDILCSHASFHRDQFDKSCAEPNNAIIPVLRKCSGLPLALAVAGGAVKRLLVSTNPNEMNPMIWSHYRSYLINSFDQFGHISGLFSGLSSCVNSVPIDKDWRTDLSVWDVFCSLGIVRNGKWVPYHILQRLWDIKKREDVISVVRPLSRHCLVNRERRGVAVGVVIADVVLDYCRHEAMKRMGLRKWHLKLLQSYIDQGRELEAMEKPANRWERFAEESQYLRENLAHHSKEALLNAKTEDTTQYRQVTEGATRVIFEHILNGNGSVAAASPGVPHPSGVYIVAGE